ncbi:MULTISPECIES: coniferyl aldehyde dehydrogenase [unclassified Paludibacterium]|uniref:coniferyl aldehyde dehydrogenase n=1 Tax=unclassified Paludibacterium TaxID=2618429 RepID=UPI001C0402CF|nr:coniferyl aldehyde dehydrogenase [Paludibacterium sp. B53371]BEV72608.1 coniferyl aldehyde dehydrogenase [Paludibacterium sp. THUN1379]
MDKQSHHDLQVILSAMKRAHLSAGPASAALRRDRLQRSARLIRDNHQALAEAMSADFHHRSEYQMMVADMLTTVRGLEHAAEHVETWMQPEPAETPAPDMQAWIEPQPLGVVGVISPWNFPINLSFGPLAGIFAAGNTAMLKPSELTPRTSDLLAELVGRYFSPDELVVVLGDAAVGQAFSALPFDHLVFTGSTAVGKHVMRAAAENLVPVTLELGGKSPVVIDQDADLQTALARTLTIKAFNAGQICLSPDYLLVTEQQLPGVIEAARQFVTDTYRHFIDNPDYTSIISPRHFERLQSLLDDARARGATIISLAAQDEADAETHRRKMVPHLVLGVTDDMAIMQEEIFGPLLPVKTIGGFDEAVAYINAHPRPLAAYYFGHDARRQRAFMQQTTSGALVINDVMTHASLDSLPFGGVGASGMGAYHGIHGFRRFTHAKAVVVQSPDGASNLRLRPPYQQALSAVRDLLNNA